ncbi:MAG: hypothetical protein HYR76_08460 [Ignavibacteria bacterium]|nr:hypothetical protein [Ignavibacteria bacterium]
MKSYIRYLILTSLFVLSSRAIAQQTPATLAGKIKRFAPTQISGNVFNLSDGDKIALDKLIAAAKLMDSLYIRQVWTGNRTFLQKLRQDSTIGGKEKFHYFLINMGPWSKLDHDEPFIEGVPRTKPPGANYYPEDMTKEEFNSWISSLPEDSKNNATGFFYTIRRNDEGRLYSNPYNTEYKDKLEPAAKLLRDAAEATDNATLKAFLTKRADAFLSNDYYESDVAWMDLDSPIEPTIGPYEVYMDELFNYKAAFEAFISIRNDAESKKLENFSLYLQEIEDHLPIDPKYRNPKLGTLSPIRVVDEVAIGGEARAGVQTAAFNLPNDERVTREKGSKRVMLKNVQEAKFNTILVPIASIAVHKKQRSMIAFEPFFTHILAHELMHGLGPHTITANGKASTVRQEMKELGSALEEAKADISGLFALQYLMDKGVIERSLEQQLYVTYLAGIFRSVRFGINESHGKGTALQFNYLSDEDAFHFDEETSTFSVNFGRIKVAVKKLTGMIMTLQAEGNYSGARELLEKYGVIRPTMQSILTKLSNVPVDIEPYFPLAAMK